MSIDVVCRSPVAGLGSPGGSAALLEHSVQSDAPSPTWFSLVHDSVSEQLLSSIALARFMARQLGPIKTGARILDPVCHSPTLLAAVIERLAHERIAQQVWIEAYNVDPESAKEAAHSLAQASQWAASHGLTVHLQVYSHDFLHLQELCYQPSLFSPQDASPLPGQRTYDVIIANPLRWPGRQGQPSRPARQQSTGRTVGLLSRYLKLIIEFLNPTGRASVVVPHSFFWSASFAEVRRNFITCAIPVEVAFPPADRAGGRTVTFWGRSVVLSFRKRPAGPSPQAGESTWAWQDTLRQPASSFTRRVQAATKGETFSIAILGSGADDQQVLRRQIAMRHFVTRQNGNLLFRLPIADLDQRIVEVIDAWPGSLERFGLRASAGPIVASRARFLLRSAEAVALEQAAPLLWVQNVKPYRVEWPLSRGSRHQGIRLSEETQPLLIPDASYVVVRQYAAAAESRRLIAAPLLEGQLNHEWVGVESRLNYIHRRHGNLKPYEALGLAAVLNYELLERYTWITAGSARITPAELYALPLPPMDVIQEIGRDVTRARGPVPTMEAGRLVHVRLQEAGLLPPCLPLLDGSHQISRRILEAQDLLHSLGIPPEQQDELSALVLLVLAQMTEDTPWEEGRRQSLRPADMLAEIRQRFGREYSQDIRSQLQQRILEPLEAYGLLRRNPDEPELSASSPRTHYALSDLAIRTVRAYATPRWPEALRVWHEGARSV